MVTDGPFAVAERVGACAAASTLNSATRPHAANRPVVVIRIMYGSSPAKAAGRTPGSYGLSVFEGWEGPAGVGSGAQYSTAVPLRKARYIPRTCLQSKG